jgi:dephospho-CoA kinase
MIKIGLTGGICSGKTFILNIFKELDCYTVRADDIAKGIIFSNRPEILAEIVKVFGQSVLDSRGNLKKEEFSRMLFEDFKKRNFINSFIHPMVTTARKTIFAELKDSQIFNFFVYESALLVESGSYKDFERILVAYTSPEEQMRRVLARDKISEEEAETRIKAQFPLSEKLKVAHYTIDTNGSFEMARTKTLETFHLLKKEFKIP